MFLKITETCVFLDKLIMKSQEWWDAREARKRMWVDRFNYLTNRLHAAAWIVLAVVVLYYSNFFLVIWESTKVNQLFFSLTMMTFGIMTAMTLYVSFILPSHEDIEVTAPRLIPLASAIGGFCYLCAHIAFWPIWGWYTPFILFSLMLGYIMLGTFMPKNSFGSVLFLAIFIFAVISFRYIPHKGLLH
ncbi:unnamed protein product [Blepharisma stoltei]|uniref:Uncharacterized protein n=1 Tax=Blepharisma stoltei TaxID=1481888 RepID=A0AAU9JSU5_9CILI|nr:unnamed protein product [Blepharisma stoltei]